MWEEAQELRTLWRISHQMPITDPRYLKASDDQVYRDLAIMRFHHRFRAESDAAGEVAAADATNDPAVAKDLIDRNREFLRDAATQSAIRLLERDGKTDAEVVHDKRPMTLRVRGRKTVE